MILNFNLTVEICGNVSIGTVGNKSGAGAEGYFKVMKILHTEQMDMT